MMKTVGELLRSARERTGLTQRDVAKRLGYASAVSYQQYERDITPVPPHKVAQIATMLGLDIEEILAYYKGNPRYEILRNAPPGFGDVRILAPEGEIRRVPVYSINAGWKMLHEPLGIIAVPANMGWPRDVIVCVVEGDSMDPTVRAGDVVIAGRDLEWSNGDMCMVSKGNDGDADALWTLKRVYRTNSGTIKLVPDNPMHETVELTGEDLESFSACPVVAVQIRRKGMRRD